MKKIFLSFALFFLLLIIFVPILASATLVPQTCGYTKSDNEGNCIENCRPCDINDFFAMLVNIYDFIVKMIATPLAIIALIVGGIFMMISAGNPALFGKGSEIIKWAIIGLVLVWGSYLIIDFILKTIGYYGNWSVL